MHLVRLWPAFAVLLVATADPGSASGAEAPGAPEIPGVSVLQASEAVSSETVADWARVVDGAVVGEVVSEERVEPPGREADGGLIGRTVRIRVLDRLWSAPGSPVLPEIVQLTAWGWIEQEEGIQRVVSSRASRLEIGHRYVLGLTRAPAVCSAEDGDEPARWVVFGSSGALPYDDGVLGQGEREGALVTSETSKRAEVPGSVTRPYSGSTDLGPFIRAVELASRTTTRERPFDPRPGYACPD